MVTKPTIIKDTRTKAQRVADANAVKMTAAMAAQFLKTATHYRINQEKA